MAGLHALISNFSGRLCVTADTSSPFAALGEIFIGVYSRPFVVPFFAFLALFLDRHSLGDVCRGY
jgi:hypothetical protein